MIKVPPAALEAGARAAWETKYKGLGWLLDCPEKHKLQWRDRAGAAIAATLNAWPGAYTANQVQAERPPVLCLPLPQEARDDH